MLARYKPIIAASAASSLSGCGKCRLLIQAAVTLLMVFALAGCDRLQAIKDGALSLPEKVLSRRGTKLTAKLKTEHTQTYRILIESSTPVWTKDSVGETLASLSLKIRTRNLAEEPDNWMSTEAEILEGRYDVDGKERPLRLAGQKVSYSYNAMRRMTRWRRLASIPCGLELLEIGPPKGRVKKGEKWQLEVRQLLLQQQEEIGIKKVFAFEGMQEIAGVYCARISVQILPAEIALSTGAKFEYGGNGEVWISAKDTGIIKATEIIEGQLRDERISEQAGRLVQAVSLAADAHASQLLSPLLAKRETDIGAKPAEAGKSPEEAKAPPAAAEKPKTPEKEPAAAKAPQEPQKPEEKKPVPPAKREAVERISYVSESTGKPEIWSIAPDGGDKRCLTGFDYAHWAPVYDASGMMMVCTSQRNRGVNVWLLKLEDGVAAPLTQFGEQDDINVAWASGGQRIVFLREGQLWSVHRDGFDLQSYDINGTVADMSAIQVSDSVAAVIDVLGQMRIVTVNIVSGAVRELFRGDYAAWSPDGKRLAYRGQDGLYIANADGSLSKRVAKADVADFPLVWDPAGNRVGFSGKAGEKVNVRAVVSTGDQEAARVTTQGGWAASFSPAGDMIAYLRHGDLWIATLDGKQQRRITSDGATRLPVRWGKHLVP